MWQHENLVNGFPMFEMLPILRKKNMLSENDKVVGIKSLPKTNSNGKVKRRIWLFCVW